MTRFIEIRDIDASIGMVFSTVANIQEFSKALPHVVRYKFLTEKQFGKGTRFRETRLM